jgi:endonuclease YncB( thermonuclease family)
MRCVAVAIAIACSSVQVSAEDAITGRPVVVDGDTLHVGTITVRLHGIDAPEADQVCNTPAGGTWSCGGRSDAGPPVAHR